MFHATDADPDILVTVKASPGRRVLGLGSLYILSLMVIYVAIANPPAAGWQVFLFALGGGALWISEQMRRATSFHLELTREELRESSGVVLARVDEITALDRGMFAFKPSNGFLLRLSRKGRRTWRPGLWWQMGSQIGVGGMTPGPQTKFMAEMISAMIAEREAG